MIASSDTTYLSRCVCLANGRWVDRVLLWSSQWMYLAQAISRMSVIR